jgi:hypothetical protein
MSAVGQKLTSDWWLLMSAILPKADMAERDPNVRFVPKADIETDQLNVGCTPKGGHWSMAFPLFIADCRRSAGCASPLQGGHIRNAER